MNTVIKEYCSSGYSGLNFNCPMLKKLIEDIRTGEINCIIITASISRIGRDYLRAGRFIQHHFYKNNIKLIFLDEPFYSEFSFEKSLLKYLLEKKKDTVSLNTVSFRNFQSY